MVGVRLSWREIAARSRLQRSLRFDSPLMQGLLTKGIQCEMQFFLSSSAAMKLLGPPGRAMAALRPKYTAIAEGVTVDDCCT